MKNVFVISTFLFLVTTLSFNACSHKKSQTSSWASDTSMSLEVQEWSKRINKYPENLEYRRNRIAALTKELRYKLAIVDMLETIDLFPENSDLYHELGDLYFADNQTVKALQTYEKSVEIDPFSRDGLYKLAQFHYFVRAFEKSKLIFDKLLKEHPSDIEAHFLLGMLAKENKDTTNAIAKFNKTIELAGTHYNATMQLGNLYSKSRPDEALKFYNMATEIDDQSDEAQYSLGLAYQEIGDLKNATIAYQRTININPKYVYAYYNVGNILALEGYYVRAIDHFNLAIKFAEDFDKAYNRIGQCYELLGDKQKAIENYEKCLEINPNLTLASEGLTRLQKNITKK